MSLVSGNVVFMQTVIHEAESQNPDNLEASIKDLKYTLSRIENKFGINMNTLKTRVDAAIDEMETMTDEEFRALLESAGCQPTLDESIDRLSETVTELEKRVDSLGMFHVEHGEGNE
jgi:archaellum component FlaC